MIRYTRKKDAILTFHLIFSAGNQIMFHIFLSLMMMISANSLTREKEGEEKAGD